MRLRSLITGASLVIISRAVLIRLLLRKFSRDVEKLNAGDHSSLLAAYAEDFVLHFHEGEHRWAGDWVGRAGMGRFLENLVRAGIQGQIREIALSGPPWALTMWVRFDDHADGPGGERIYENRTVLLVRTRWGKVIEQEDFYTDTDRILALDRRLTELGIDAVPKGS